MMREACPDASMDSRPRVAPRGICPRCATRRTIGAPEDQDILWFPEPGASIPEHTLAKDAVAHPELRSRDLGKRTVGFAPRERELL